MPQAARGKETSLSDRMDQDRLFPTLTSAQDSRESLRTAGVARSRREICSSKSVEASVPFFVVLSGDVQVVAADRGR